MKMYVCLVLLLVLGLSSCRKKEYPCTEAAFVPTFIGQNIYDIDNMMIYFYEKNTQFSVLLDSMDSFGFSDTLGKGDTIRLFTHHMDLPFSTKYDYKFKSTRTTFEGGKSIISISDMLVQDKNMKCRIDKEGTIIDDDCYCMDNLISAKVENRTQSTFKLVTRKTGYGFKGYELFILP